MLPTTVAWDHPPTGIGYTKLVARRAVWLVGFTGTGLCAGTALPFQVQPLGVVVCVFVLIAVLFIFRPQGIVAVPHAERV